MLLLLCYKDGIGNVKKIRQKKMQLETNNTNSLCCSHTLETKNKGVPVSTMLTRRR